MDSSQYSSVVGDILGDPAALMALASVIVPNFTVGGFQFKPREALRAGSQLYGEAANRQALQKEIGQIAKTSLFKPPTAYPEQETFVADISPTLKERVEYATKFEPPSEAQIMSQLSPKAFKAAYGTRTAMGDFSSIVSRMREGELGKAGREKERLLSEAWTQFEKNPSDENMQNVLIGLSKDPGATSKEFAVTKNLQEYLGSELPKHMQSKKMFLARYAPQYALSLTRDNQVAKTQLSLINEQFKHMPGNTRKIFEHNALYGVPTSPELLTSITTGQLRQDRIDEAAKKFPAVDSLLYQNVPMDDSVFKGLRDAGYSDVIALLDDKQTKIKELRNKDEQWRKEFEAAQAHRAFIEKETVLTRRATEGYRSDEQRYRYEDRKRNDELAREKSKSDILLKLEDDIRFRDSNIAAIQGRLLSIEQGLSPTPEELVAAKQGNLKPYKDRLRRTVPTYADLERQAQENVIAKQMSSVRRDMTQDPTGGLLIRKDLSEWAHSIGKIEDSIVVSSPSLSEAKKAQLVEKIDAEILTLENAKRRYGPEIPNWDRVVYGPYVKKLRDMRVKLKNTLPTVTPPGGFSDLLIPPRGISGETQAPPRRLP